MKRISGGLFKNRVGNRRAKIAQKASADEDPTASDDDLSFSSSPVPGPEGKVAEDARWSVAVGKNIHEADHDEDDDIYTSDGDADEPAEHASKNSDVAAVTSPKKTTNKDSKSPNSPKRKKVKKIDAAMPLVSPGKLKKKKKKAAGGASTVTSADSSKSKKKGKTDKTKKSKDTSDIQSFAEIDKLSEKKNSKSKKKTKKGIAPPVGDASDEKKIAVTKLSIRSNFFQNNPLYMSIRNNFVSKARLSNIDDESQSPSSDQPTQDHHSQPKDIDGKKLKADAVTRIRAFAIFRDRIQDQKQFLAAFNNAEDDKEDDTTMAQNSNQHREKSYNKLVSELQQYEIMLEKEREEMADIKATMQLQQESVEQLLQEETEKNRELQLQMQQLQDQFYNGGQDTQLEDVKEKNRVLEAENELLQQKNERQQETINSIMVAEKSEMKRQLSVGPLEDRKPTLDNYLVSPSTTRRKFRPTRPSIAEEGSTELRMDDDDSPDWDEQSGFMSMSSMSGKAQGELLQLRSTLKNKTSALEEQAKELAQVKRDLETLKEDQGVKNLTRHVENLENEKKFFVSEIGKLKKELDESRRREMAAAEAATGTTAPTPPQAEKETVDSGWFGFGSRTPSKTEAATRLAPKDKTKDIVNDLNGSMVYEEPSSSESETVQQEKQPARLSGLLDF
ncbi:unnamed protein product [Cylindrotheca closterium]|uniref:Uncharacterized protein n=1 Tax=Cylindrotheca closterium TaxID=2856 RepID=A0AAD2JJL1_9STRA|nr:unnamed protein product [Cylindrotheca closterium]